MNYGKMAYGRMHKRMNRFIAEVFVNGQKEKVHVKNTGRLKELLQPDAEVALEMSQNPNRKTKYSLIAVRKNGYWVNIDSQAPNVAAFEAIKQGKLREFGQVKAVNREVAYGASRFDLSIEEGDRKGFIEVKGVTLAKNGIAMFPDAPTARGTKHVLELVKAVREGYSAAILFVVQMKGCRVFSPNREMDREFADALLEASKEGVKILAYDSLVKADELVLDAPLPVALL